MARRMPQLTGPDLELRKLARDAQAASIMDATEAFSTLIAGAKKSGAAANAAAKVFTYDFPAIYAEYATATGKERDGLSCQDRQQAILNHVLRQNL